jgi:hypothetical protein
MWTRDDILRFIDSLSPYSNDDSTLYTIGGGGAINLLANNDREISDLDLLFLGEDKKRFAENCIGFEEGQESALELDLQFSGSYFGSIETTSQDVRDNYVVEVELEGKIVPVLSPEFVAVSKLTSWMGSQKEGLPHISRKKDVLDIVALWETRGLKKDSFEELVEKVPHADVSPQLLYDVLVRNIQQYNGEQSSANINILRNTTQTAEIMGRFENQDEVYQRLTNFVADGDIAYASNCLSAIGRTVVLFSDPETRRDVFDVLLDYSKRTGHEGIDKISSGIGYTVGPDSSVEMQNGLWGKLKPQIDTCVPQIFLEESVAAYRAERKLGF